MEKGISYATQILLKYIPEKDIKEYIEEVRNHPVEEMDFTEDLEVFDQNRTMEEYMVLRGYTGYNFRKINAVLRKNWSYEENGLLTEEEQRRFMKEAESIKKLIEAFPSPKKDFLTYRGTTLREFQKYGIHSLEELVLLKGNYLYEEGFTSTSLSQDSSYFGKNINGEEINIEVIYHIPRDSQDGMPLITDALSYSKEQQEYLLSSHSLSFVEDVKVERNIAYMRVIMIPKKVWNRESKKEEVKGTEANQL